MTRYRADGCHVYQGDTLIITCNDGDQGQAASAIAARVAALLEADFLRFCMAVAGGATRTHGRLPERRPAAQPMEPR